MNALTIIKESAVSDSMIWFHKLTGLYPDVRYFISSAYKTFLFILESLVVYFLYRISKGNKYALVVAGIVSVVIFVATNDFHRFVWLAPILTIVSILNWKKLWLNKPLMLFVLIAIFASLKSFWHGRVVISYGAYTLPLVFAALVSLYFYAYSEKAKNMKNFLVFLFITLSLNISYLGFNYRFKYLTAELKGPNDSMYSNYIYTPAITEAAEWLKENSKPTDRVLVYPEGEIINVMAERPAHYMYYSLNSILMDTFGSMEVVNTLRKDNIEYIIMVKGFLIFTFGNNNFYPYFNNYVYQNYDMVKRINVKSLNGKTEYMEIFRLKNLK